MLVLTRKRDESIQINVPREALAQAGDGGITFTITVTQARPGVAQLGIDAPRYVRVKRSELADVPRRAARF